MRSDVRECGGGRPYIAFSLDVSSRRRACESASLNKCRRDEGVKMRVVGGRHLAQSSTSAGQVLKRVINRPICLLRMPTTYYLPCPFVERIAPPRPFAFAIAFALACLALANDDFYVASTNKTPSFFFCTLSLWPYSIGNFFI